MKMFLLVFSVGALASCNDGVRVEVNVDSLSKKAGDAVDKIENKIDSSAILDSIRAKSGRFLDSTRSKGGRLVKKAEKEFNNRKKKDPAQ